MLSRSFLSENVMKNMATCLSLFFLFWKSMELLRTMMFPLMTIFFPIWELFISKKQEKIHKNNHYVFGTFYEQGTKWNLKLFNVSQWKRCITFGNVDWSNSFFCLLTSSNITLYVDPVLMKFFSRTLSRAGSNSSPTSSISKGRPRDKLSSRWFLKYLWFSEVICENNRTSLLTQLKFCYWGKLLPE